MDEIANITNIHGGGKKDIDETWMTIIVIEFMDEIHHINVISHVDETI